MLDGACRRVSACLADSTRQAAGPFPLSTLRRWVNEQKMPPTVTVTQCLRPSMAAAIPETDAHTQVWRPSDAAHSMRLGEVLGRVGWAPPPPPAPPMYVGPMPPPQRPGGPPPAIPQNPYAVNPSPQKCAAATRPATDCACSSTASVAPAAHRRAYRAADRCCTSGGGILPAATDRCVRASGGLPATHGPRRRRRAAACVGACAAYCANRLVPAKPVQALHRSSSYP